MKNRIVVVMAMLGLALLLVAACQPIVMPVTPQAMQEGDSHDEGMAHSHEMAEASADGETPLMDNLGSHVHPISTNNETAQKYFNQGLILAYGFNHELAIASFKEALKHDPECAMCYWGIAWALGPNINLPMDNAVVPDAWAALTRAQELAPKASEQDQAYIKALAARYAAEPVDDRAPLDLAFANAMRELKNAYPDDLDAASIFAESLMDTIPWNYWTPEGEPREATVEILATLESVLARDPDHPAANHYYIHATEASKNPEVALESAKRLETLVPGAGHLVHMPAHTYWRVGRYYDAYRVNLTAHNVDMHTMGGTPDQGTFYSLAYYPHNLHFLFAAAQMMGNSKDAIQAARDVSTSLDDATYLASPYLEDFKPMPYYALVRFGKWDEILAEPAPAKDLVMSTGMWNFAQGMALLRTGKIEEAQKALASLQEIAAKPEMDSQVLQSFASARQILKIASGILAGEIAATQGDYEKAVAELDGSVAIQDSLSYIEPPAWFYPARQTLGAVLLEAGRAEEAEAVYRKDLEQYRANGWSLFGLMTALDAQGKRDEATKVKAEFEEAWQHADVELTSSRF